MLVEGREWEYVFEKLCMEVNGLRKTKNRVFAGKR